MRLKSYLDGPRLTSGVVGSQSSTGSDWHLGTPALCMPHACLAQDKWRGLSEGGGPADSDPERLFLLSICFPRTSILGTGPDLFLAPKTTVLSGCLITRVTCTDRRALPVFCGFVPTGTAALSLSVGATILNTRTTWGAVGNEFKGPCEGLQHWATPGRKRFSSPVQLSQSQRAPCDVTLLLYPCS